MEVIRPTSLTTILAIVFSTLSINILRIPGNIQLLLLPSS